MFNRKESLGRKLRVVTAGVTSLAGAGALVHLLNQEASLVQAAEPPKPGHVEADPAFLNHLEGQYQDVRIVREPIGLNDGCIDTDRNELYPDGINVWVKGTLTLPSGRRFTDFCYYEPPGYNEYPLTEYHCLDGDKWSSDSYFCARYGATCQDGACVPKEQPTPEPTLEPGQEGLVTITGKDESLRGAKLVGCSPDLEVCYQDEDHPLAVIGPEGDWGIYGAPPGETGLRICNSEVQFCSDLITRDKPHWWDIELRPVGE